MSARSDRRPGDREAARRGLWAPFASLMGGQGIATALGIVFWVLAARFAEPVDIGIATAAISTQTLLGILTSLGLGTQLITEIPTTPADVVRRLLQRALLGAGIVGVALAAVVVAGVETVRALGLESGGALAEGLTDPLVITGFVLGVVAATCAIVLDEAVLGLRRAEVQLRRNVTASVLRLVIGALLLVAVGPHAWVIQATWVLPILISLALAFRALRLAAAVPRPWRDDVREHLPPALRHYVLNLAAASASQVIPVIAGVSLAATDNAAFAVAWLLAGAAFLPPYLLTAALYAHAAHGPGAEAGPAGAAALAENLRRTVPVALGFVLAAWAGAALLGEHALRILGGTYAEESSHLLVLLVPAGLWAVVKDHLIVVWRRQKRFRLATGITVVTLLAETAGAVTGAVLGGATGLVVGWLAVTVLEFAWGAVVLIGHMRSPAAPRPARDERGRAAWSLVALLVVSALVALGLVVGLIASGQDAEDEADEKPVGTAKCTPSPDDPGPVLDLSVEADVGDPVQPFLAEYQVDDLVEAAQDAGAGVISTTLSWRVAQPQRGQAYDFRGLDLVVDAARRSGLDVKVRLVNMAFWAFDAGATKYGPWAPPRTSSELARWTTFVRDTTRHLGGKARYLEIWSDPDDPQYWRTGPNAEEYARMLRASAVAVKSVNPGIDVVSGRVDGTGSYLGELLDQFEGRQAPFDLVGLHLTGDPQAMLDPSSMYQPAIDELKARGSDLSVYVTRMGWPTTEIDDAGRAERLPLLLDAMSCERRLRVVTWYALHPSLRDSPSWALLDGSQEPSATYDALRDWSTRRERAVGDAVPDAG